MDKYRETVIAFKNAVKESGIFYVYDTETTGLNPDNCDVIEFAAIKCDKEFNIVDSIDIFINVGYLVPEIITELTGITDEDLKAGYSPIEAATEIRNFLGTAPILAWYNSVSFDTKFMKKMFREQLQMDFDQTMQLDVLVMAKEKTEKPHKLCNMADKAGLTGIEFHRAVNDCEATLGVLKWLIPMYDEAEPTTSSTDFKVYGIKRWQKSETLDRLYVSNSLNISMYLDIPRNTWFVGANCEEEPFVKKVYEFAGVTCDSELLAKF